MAPDSAVTGSATEHGEVMASVDDGALLVADVSRDDAWLSMPREQAPVLAEHC
ncbi:DUF7556 family protein [Halosegnis marinus]|uniref:Uncharacterized protein n=1 Tax=Halosegnis marinus TaxID=3034023 RepID=A0ABD5ZNY6_9EURY|nr:hypothetical protein [Halosegnis sp. DT85]